MLFFLYDIAFLITFLTMFILSIHPKNIYQQR